MTDTQDPNADAQAPEVQQAVQRYLELRDAFEDARALSSSLSEDTRRLRRELSKAVAFLDRSRDPDHTRQRDRAHEKRLEAQITSVKAEMHHKQQRIEEMGRRGGELRELLDACKAFLERDGATIDSLIAGVPLPPRRDAAPTMESRQEEGQRAAQQLFGGRT